MIEVHFHGIFSEILLQSLIKLKKLKILINYVPKTIKINQTLFGFNSTAFSVDTNNFGLKYLQ